MRQSIHLRQEWQQGNSESGVAIILSLFFIIIVMGLVTSGTLLMKASRDRSEVKFRVEAQAAQFARSGITEGLSWFRRQTTQPVSVFSPVRDTVSTPNILDTDDPTIGLVREFQIAGDIWGRYEVWKEDNADPDPQRLAWRQQYQVDDLSAERGFANPGSAWRLRSIGYVFKVRDSNVAFDQQPNRILGSMPLEAEIKRLTLQPPGQAALSVSSGNDAHINTNGRITGGAAAGIFYPDGPGSGPTTGPANQNRVTGTPSTSPVDPADYDDSVEAVFGVTEAELRSMADLVITNANDFPDPVPDNAIVFCEVASITFDAARSLNGTAIVYIKGNVSVISGNNSNFNGMLYIDGNFTLRATSVINGAVVAKGNVTVQGSGDFAIINYDDDVLNALRLEIGQYRWAGALHEILDQD